MLITACSDAIEKYCRRRFVSVAYDELYNGGGDRRLLLRQYPVQSVRYRPVTVLKITNTTIANVQARVGREKGSAGKRGRESLIRNMKT